jgi:hypothetical protein
METPHNHSKAHANSCNMTSSVPLHPSYFKAVIQRLQQGMQACCGLMPITAVPIDHALSATAAHSAAAAACVAEDL